MMMTGKQVPVFNIIATPTSIQERYILRCAAQQGVAGRILKDTFVFRTSVPTKTVSLTSPQAQKKNIN